MQLFVAFERIDSNDLCISVEFPRIFVLIQMPPPSKSLPFGRHSSDGRSGHSLNIEFSHGSDKKPHSHCAHNFKFRMDQGFPFYLYKNYY